MEIEGKILMHFWFYKRLYAKAVEKVKLNKNAKKKKTSVVESKNIHIKNSFPVEETGKRVQCLERNNIDHEEACPCFSAIWFDCLGNL